MQRQHRALESAVEGNRFLVGALRAARILVRGFPLHSCVDRIIGNFVTAGTARGLDTRCTDKLKPMPFFITLAGPAP